jgi:hypothetical protein
MDVANQPPARAANERSVSIDDLAKGVLVPARGVGGEQVGVTAGRREFPDKPIE